jgi:hypothetical protein
MGSSCLLVLHIIVCGFLLKKGGDGFINQLVRSICKYWISVMNCRYSASVAKAFAYEKSRRLCTSYFSNKSRLGMIALVIGQLICISLFRRVMGLSSRQSWRFNLVCFVCEHT